MRSALSTRTRQSARLLGAAVAPIVLASLGSAAARAGLIIELKATSLNGSTAAISDPKSVVAPSGAVITFNVVAHLSGTDATQQFGNFDNASPNTDTRNDEALDAV